MIASNLRPICFSNLRKKCLSPNIHMKTPGKTRMGPARIVCPPSVAICPPSAQSLCLGSMVPYWFRPDHCPLSLTMQNEGGTP